MNIGEEEPEDVAVRRYMKAVMESKVLEVLRWRKTKETKIEVGHYHLRQLNHSPSQSAPSSGLQAPNA